MASKKPSGKFRSLKVTDAFRQFVLDQLDELGAVVPRAMFGGVGLYRDGVFFGLIAGDELYLKVDDRTRPQYERAGMHAFTPYPGQAGSMKYWSVPVDVLESPRDLTEWARKAVDAREARAGSARSRKRR